MSFWLLLKRLPSALRRQLLLTTGTLRSAAAAPYLSAQICSKACCSHVDAGKCKALQTLVSVGRTSLFNRFLLREKATYARDPMHMDTRDVAHYAIVVG